MINCAHQSDTTVCKRYVDDILCVVEEHSEINHVLHTLNNAQTFALHQIKKQTTAYHTQMCTKGVGRTGLHNYHSIEKQRGR